MAFQKRTNGFNDTLRQKLAPLQEANKKKSDQEAENCFGEIYLEKIQSQKNQIIQEVLKCLLRLTTVESLLVNFKRKINEILEKIIDPNGQKIINVEDFQGKIEKIPEDYDFERIREQLRILLNLIFINDTALSEINPRTLLPPLVTNLTNLLKEEEKKSDKTRESQSYYDTEDGIDIIKLLRSKKTELSLSSIDPGSEDFKKFKTALGELYRSNIIFRELFTDPDLKELYLKLSSARELETLVKLLNLSPRIEKEDLSGYYGDKFYSLWWGLTKEWWENFNAKSPILLCEEGQLKYLYCRRCDDPLELLTLRRVDGKDSTGKYEEGCFYDLAGHKLPDTFVRSVSEIFHQVKIGVEILPRPKEPKGYKIKKTRTVEDEENGAQKKTFIPRTWGQLFLAEQSPDKVVLGQILGSGGSYKAYTYGDKVVVEFDQEAHGTYFFERAYFESLKIWSRSDIIQSKPKGFYGKIHHIDNKKDLWKKRVTKFLSQSFDIQTETPDENNDDEE
jgi:hypothetical protein